ncbi:MULTISPECIES: TetR/AcrR family transcriptional regulator [unclassified Corynebacterium]|uniref:TetR/AcrR family transcriptional regulator n=1 Tax=unclassified Corynebacterium TaxID=2624378 RepID=UPI0029C9D935|nr:MULTISPECIES: TetR/AcrR family transcriptional regulator [unclassified Corynebacterium]WPF66817.1 TetR/AcrR family transcriptional regulator [Corynebacterium sp. 22KM0430]WPF69305.1 TetR/AcrR family transcriptional regulator [Corynebacterium sp. 21KM1197]
MTSLRETKKAATRSALAESAAAIALAQGVEGLTVAAIAENAGVSPRTFHNYFSSREEALFHALVRRVRALMEEMNNLPPGLSLLSAMEEVAVRGLHHDSSHFASLSVIARLGEVGEALGNGDIKTSMKQEFDGLIEKLHSCFPDLSEMEIKISLGAASQAIVVALMDVARNSDSQPGDEERLIRQAFAILRGLA